MAIKKSALYASLWASCDELRGGMDGSQSLVVARFFAAEQAEVDALQSALDGIGQELESFIEENSGEEGLNDLRRFLTENHIKSIAIPPLGAGNGGLEWQAVKSRIEQVSADLVNVKIWVFEPTTKYQNVAKKSGVSKLSPARALVAELVRRYWILGMECSLLEIQKLVWFLQRVLEINGLKNVLNLNFEANNYGPYANNLNHLLNALDGSYLKSDKRIPDSTPLDVIAFNDAKKQQIEVYLNSEGREFLPGLEKASKIIDGFESPFGMELLSTVDWLLVKGGCEPTLESVKCGIATWPTGKKWAERKLSLFDDKSLQIAINRLSSVAFS